MYKSALNEVLAENPIRCEVCTVTSRGCNLEFGNEECRQQRRRIHKEKKRIHEIVFEKLKLEMHRPTLLEFLSDLEELDLSDVQEEQ